MIEKKYKEAGIILSDPSDVLWENIEPEGRLVDNGIGPYEFWGFKGNHTQIDFESEDSGREIISWKQIDLPNLNELFSIKMDKSIWIETRRGDEEFSVEICAELASFETALRTQKFEGKALSYWQCTAVFNWEVVN